MVTSSQTEATLEQKGPEWALSVGQGMRGLSQDTSHSLRLLCICHLCKHQFAWSCLDAVPSLSQLCPPTCILSLVTAAFFLAQSCSRAPGARAGAAVGWEACWSGRQQKSQAISVCFLFLVLASKQVCMHHLWVEPGFLTALLLNPPGFKPVKGTHVANVKP